MTAIGAVRPGRAVPATGVADGAVTDGADLARWLAGATLVAALVELVLLRVATRTAIHIPGIDEVAGPYQAVSSVARFAFYAANVLVLAALVGLSRRLSRDGLAGAAVAAGAAVVAALGLRLGALSTVTFAVAVAVAVTVLAGSLARHRAALRLPVSLLAAAFVASAAHGVLEELAGRGVLVVPSTSLLLVGAEATVLAALVALGRSVAAPGRRAVGAGVVAAIGAFGALTAGSATTKILLLWTFGLAGYFPAVAYALASGAAVTALLVLRRRSPGLAVGVALVLAGGIGLHTTYQSLLVVCGLAVLATEAERGVRPAGAVG